MNISKIVFVLFVPALMAMGQTSADYGDAPDSYQTLFESGGPFHATVNQEWMSWANWFTTTTTTENNALIEDGDFDDGFAMSVLLFPRWRPRIRGQLLTDLWIPVSVAQNGPTLNRFLNVFIDFDNNGTFWDAGDWVMQNQSVINAPGETWMYQVQSGSNQSLWTRQILSRNPLNRGNFQSAGTFGETEDYRNSVGRVPLLEPMRVSQYHVWRNTLRPNGHMGVNIWLRNQSRFDVIVDLLQWQNLAPNVTVDPPLYSGALLPGGLNRPASLFRFDFYFSGQTPFTATSQKVLRTHWAPDIQKQQSTAGYVFEDTDVLFYWNDSLRTGMVFDTLLPLPYEVTEGETITFDVRTESDLVDSVELKAVHMPAGATFKNTGGSPPITGHFQWCPSFAGLGEDSAVFVSTGKIRTLTVYDTLVVPLFAHPVYDYPYIIADCCTTAGVRGDTAKILFDLSNWGDRSDVFHCQVDDSLGWTFDSFFDIFLEITLDSVILVKIPIPESIPPGTIDKIYFTASSDGDPRLVTVDTIPVVVVPTAVEEKPARTELPFAFYATLNPFNTLTGIHYTVTVPGQVKINLYDATGRRVRTVVDEHRDAARYKMKVSAKNLAKGVYFLRYEDTINRAQIKLVVL